MSIHDLTIEDLQLSMAQSVNLTYNCDAADQLSMSFTPAQLAELGLAAGDRINLTVEGRRVFSGTLMTDPSHAISAGANEQITVVAESDLGLLSRMAYVKIDDDGNARYPAPEVNWEDASTLATTVFNRMANWDGSPVTTGFSAQVTARVPARNGNSATPAATVIQDAMAWVPDAVLVQRYNTEGDQLLMTRSSALEALSFAQGAPLQAVAITARPDLVPPVCALVGGDTYKIPGEVDVRTPGAFIFAVPVDRDNDSARAGGSPASQKMIVRGTPIPDRYQLTRGEDEYTYTDIVGDSATYKFLRRFFPQYKDLLGACMVGSALVSIVTREQLEAEAEAEAEEDEDAQPVPANYSDSPQNWTAAERGGIYVLTEGSFPASSRATRNLRGLLWCKGQVTLMLRLPFANRDQVPAVLKPAVPTLFPGKERHWSDSEGKYTTSWLARLTLDCIFVNRRKRIFDAATAQPCTTDSEYDPALDDQPTETDYRAALADYYNASRAIPYEGSISLLYDGSLWPEELTGRMLTVHGLRTEWETMNAVVRSVSWDVGERKLSIDVGSRAVLDFDEYLQRRLMNKMERIERTQRELVPYDVTNADDKKKAESEMTVSPSVSASVAPASTGVHRKPFSLYEVVVGEGSEATTTIWLAGGTLSRAGLTYNVPDTQYQIQNGAATDSGWTRGLKIRLKWTTVNGVQTYSIYQKS